MSIFPVEPRWIKTEGFIYKRICDAPIYPEFIHHHRLTQEIRDADFCNLELKDSFDKIRKYIDNKTVHPIFIQNFLVYMFKTTLLNFEYYDKLYQMISGYMENPGMETDKLIEYINTTDSGKIPIDSTVPLLQHYISTPFLSAILEKDYQKFVSEVHSYIDNSTSQDFIKYVFSHGTYEMYKYLKLNGYRIKHDFIFEHALEGGNIEIISDLVSQYPNVNLSSYYMKAIEYNQNEIADWILSNYGNFPEESVHISIPFKAYNFSALCFLIENGIDFNNTEPIVYDICFTHFIFIIKLKKFINCSLCSSLTNKLPLMVAVETRSCEIVNFFLDRGANINQQYSNTNLRQNIVNEIYHFHFHHPFLLL